MQHIWSPASEACICPCPFPNLRQPDCAWILRATPWKLNLIIGGSCHKYNFCCDKSLVARNTCLSWQTCVCHNKTCLLLQQKHACHDKTLSWQNYVCHDKSLVATNTCLSQQKFCLHKHTFVSTKMVLGASPISACIKMDKFVLHTHRHRSRTQPCWVWWSWEQGCRTLWWWPQQSYLHFSHLMFSISR